MLIERINYLYFGSFAAVTAMVGDYFFTATAVIGGLYVASALRRYYP